MPRQSGAGAAHRDLRALRLTRRRRPLLQLHTSMLHLYQSTITMPKRRPWIWMVAATPRWQGVGDVMAMGTVAVTMMTMRDKQWTWVRMQEV